MKQIKNFFLFLLKGSFSNQTLLDDSEEHSYIPAIVIMIISIILAIVPSFVSIANTNVGSMFTDSPNASLDTSVALFSQHLNSDSKYKLELKDGKFDTTNAVIGDTDATEYVVYVKKDNPDGSGQVDLETLVIKIAAESDVDSLLTMYKNGQYTKDGAMSITPRSCIIFTPEHMYVKTFLRTATNTVDDSGKITAYASYTTNYVGNAAGIKDTDIKTLYVAADLSKTTTNWSNFVVSLYASTKTAYLWSYTGILFAINFGVIALISLLLFLISRMKSSVRKYNYFEAFKIICFASLLPAIIGLALGFMISNIAQIGFVLCLGIRATFLTMKTSTPKPIN